MLRNSSRIHIALQWTMPTSMAAEHSQRLELLILVHLDYKELPEVQVYHLVLDVPVPPTFQQHCLTVAIIIVWYI